MTILLSLGIPVSNTTAMLIAAFMIHGLQLGPLLYSQRPDIIFGIFVAMLVTNIFLVALSIRRGEDVSAVEPSALCRFLGGDHGPLRHWGLRVEGQRG